MQCGTQGHMAEPREPTRCAAGAQVARMHGRDNASPRGRLGDAKWQEGWHLEGPQISGPWL